MMGCPWDFIVLSIATPWSWCSLSWRLYVTMWCTVSSTAMPTAIVAIIAVAVFRGTPDEPHQAEHAENRDDVRDQREESRLERHEEERRG